MVSGPKHQPVDNTAFQRWASQERERRDGAEEEDLCSYRLDGLSRKTTGSRHQAGEQREVFGVGVLERERETRMGAPGLQTVSCCECQNNKTAQVQMDDRDETGVLPLQATESL